MKIILSVDDFEVGDKVIFGNAGGLYAKYNGLEGVVIRNKRESDNDFTPFVVKFDCESFKGTIGTYREFLTHSDESKIRVRYTTIEEHEANINAFIEDNENIAMDIEELEYISYNSDSTREVLEETIKKLKDLIKENKELIIKEEQEIKLLKGAK